MRLHIGPVHVSSRQGAQAALVDAQLPRRGQHALHRQDLEAHAQAHRRHHNHLRGILLFSSLILIFFFLYYINKLFVFVCHKCEGARDEAQQERRVQDCLQRMRRYDSKSSVSHQVIMFCRFVFIQCVCNYLCLSMSLNV